MRAQLNKREPEILARWEELDLYHEVDRKNIGREKFILHDGPPYANGNIHLGTSLNKILKDVIVRFKTMCGHETHFVPGWDCHGLPIEQRVQADLGPEVMSKSALEIRRLCEQHALKYMDIQRKQFKRLGVHAVWDQPYLTMSPQYEVGILRALREVTAKGYVYRGHKPVYWDPDWKTALAEAEIEYAEITSPSVYVRFPVIDQDEKDFLRGLKNLSIVIWTTTPWTLPANLAVALHPEYEYSVVRVGDEHIVVASYLRQGFLEICGLAADAVVSTHAGREFEGLHCSHPMIEGKQSLVILGEHVTLEAGTGAVHTAPGHGMEDYLVAQEYGLPIFVPVDENGCYTDKFPMMQGMFVWDANIPITRHLKEKGLLVHSASIRHQYPHSWRSHKPVIYRATSQWFMDLSEGVRERALEIIDREVRWIPAWGRDRIFNMVQSRPEWCLSRQRSWGVPIPAVHCEGCKTATLDIAVLDKLIGIVATEGTNAWFERPVTDFLPEGFACPKCGGAKFEKGKDILDVWFDSGSSHISVLDADPRLGSPAALYLEGSDQHRGWFQASLLIGTGVNDRAPFRSVLTHGFTVDEKGEAMHKSKGNVVDPADVIEHFGADVLRLWVISEDYRNDIKYSRQIIERMSDAYRRIRNTFRFLLGNLSDYDPKRDAVAHERLPEMDRWALHELGMLIERVRQAYDEFEFHRVFHLTHGFCAVEMSAIYLDIVKDRLYCQAPDDPERRSVQTVLYAVLESLLRMLAPILVFTTDEAWQHLNGEARSVHLSEFPPVDSEWNNPELAARWRRLLDVRSEVARGLEAVRQTKEIGHSLDARVTIYPKSDEVRALLERYRPLLEEWFITSKCEVAAAPPVESELTARGELVDVKVWRSELAKCERCWRREGTVGQNPEGATICARCDDVARRIG